MTFLSFINNLDLILTNIFSWLTQITTALQTNFIFIMLFGTIIFIFVVEKIIDVFVAVRDSTDSESGGMNE